MGFHLSTPPGARKEILRWGDENHGNDIATPPPPPPSEGGTQQSFIQATFFPGSLFFLLQGGRKRRDPGNEIVIQGGSAPRSKPLPLYILFFDRKGTPFRIPSTENCTPFIYLRSEFYPVDRLLVFCMAFQRFIKLVARSALSFHLLTPTTTTLLLTL